MWWDAMCMLYVIVIKAFLAQFGECYIGTNSIVCVCDEALLCRLSSGMRFWYSTPLSYKCAKKISVSWIYKNYFDDYD